MQSLRVISMDRSRRKSQRETSANEEHPSEESMSKEALIVSKAQLKELWQYDNECGRKFMKGCPLRSCSVDGQSSNENGYEHGLSAQEMVEVKKSIYDMWKQMGTFFEIFTVKEERHLGHRLRVKKDVQIKLSLKQEDAIHCGWLAKIPDELSESHVFKRSWVEPNCYLGGPVSYMNWCSTNKQNIRVLQSLNCKSICKMYTKRILRSGMELQWNYGRSAIPQFVNWFNNECCQESNADPAAKKRHDHKATSRDFSYKELCVLCGLPFSNSNKENRVQRKQHFVNAHADFFGSEWNGKGCYDQQPVHPDTLFCEADKLNHLLSALKSMKWSVLPACRVFSQEELDNFGNDSDALMDEFDRRQELLKTGGVLTLRGFKVPTDSSDFSSIEPRNWKVLKWMDDKKPTPGRFAVPPELKDKHELSLPEVVSSFCDKYL